MLILIILLQRQDSSGGGIIGGANLGGGPVARNPLAKPTAWLAAIFMVNCVILAMLSLQENKTESVFDGDVIDLEISDVAPVAPERESLVPTEIPNSQN